MSLDTYPKETYGVEGILRVMFWNAGVCSIAIVAKKGDVDDWAAYVGALPNQALKLDEETRLLVEAAPDYRVTEEEVVRYTVRRGGKLLAKEASALFPSLPAKQYRR